MSGAFDAFRLDNNARLSALESLAARSRADDEATSSEPTVARITSVAPVAEKCALFTLVRYEQDGPHQNVGVRSRHVLRDDHRPVPAIGHQDETDGLP